jgi:NAD(P)-dependent dehydrogenase (short-subunit alcohol dehydrogenase family)
MGWLTGRTALVTLASRGIRKSVTLLVAELVLFFVSPASDYITGQVLPGIYD